VKAFRRFADSAERTVGPERLMAAPRLFYRSLLEFVRDLPGSQKRFWILVILTGLAGGLGRWFCSAC